MGGNSMSSGVDFEGFPFLEALRRAVSMGCLICVLGCGGGAKAPVEVARNQFLEGNFPKAIEVAETVVSDSTANQDDRAAMLVLKGRCYYELGAEASPADQQMDFFQQGLSELGDCVEFMKQHAVTVATEKAKAQGVELAEGEDELPGILRNNLSEGMLASLSEALHITSSIHRELGDEKAAAAAQRMWREVDSAFLAAYTSEKPEEVLLDLSEQDSQADVEEPDDADEEYSADGQAEDDSTLLSGRDEEEADFGDGDVDTPNLTRRPTGSDGFESTAELETNQRLGAGRDESARTRTRPSSATTSSLTENRRNARTQDGDGRTGEDREERAESDRSPRSSTGFGRGNYAISPELTPDDEETETEETGDEEQNATDEEESPRRAPTAPYTYQPLQPGPSGGGSFYSPPTTGIGGGRQYESPQFNAAPTTGIGGGSLATGGNTVGNYSQPSTGIGGGSASGGQYGAGLPSLDSPRPTSPQFGLSGIVPPPQGIPLTGTLPASQRSPGQTPSQQQYWPNYAPLRPNVPSLPAQGLNGLPPNIGQPGYNPSARPGVGLPPIYLEPLPEGPASYGSSLRLDGPDF